MMSAFLTPGRSRPVCHTRKAAIPMSRYSVTQAGPNSQFGGMKGGLRSEAYQVGIAPAVKADPTTPAHSDATMLTTSLRTFLRPMCLSSKSLQSARSGKTAPIVISKPTTSRSGAWGAWAI
jgi:hypothetical protein